MTERSLHLVAGEPHDRPGSCSPVSPCRRPGCEGDSSERLGFCLACSAFYDVTNARRGRFADVLCARLSAVGDPLFAVFGSSRPRCFGAHVAAHLEELEARHVHVPEAAVLDYVAELDERGQVVL